MAGRLARVRSKADSALDGHRYESTDSSDDEAMRAVPAGCLGRTGVRLVAEAKGWGVVETAERTRANALAWLAGGDAPA